MVMTISLTAVAVVAAALLALSRYARVSDNWGASKEEIALSLPGDDWLAGGPSTYVRLTRVVAVEATREQVWPWIAQMGRGAGWYSYDRLDNGGRLSASHVIDWIPDPLPGDASAIGYLRHLEPGRQLVWWLEGTRFLGHSFRGVMLYRVSGEGEHCRLLARFHADVNGALAGVASWLFRCVDAFMARRQLLEIKRRAERYGARSTDPERPETGERDQYQLYQVVYASGDTAGVRGKESAARWRRAALDDGVIERQTRET